MRIFPPPRLFLSYAREDRVLALTLRKALVERGFAVFVDTEGILAGEDFVGRIAAELRRVQAVVALLTPHAAASPWCQAEVYQAQARRVPVIPVQVGSEPVALAPPVALTLQRIHRIEVQDTGELAGVSSGLATQLHTVRRQARRRAITRLLGGFGVLALLGLAGFSGLRGVNTWNEAQERRAVIDRLESADRPLRSNELGRIVSRFQGDRELLGKALLLARDPAAGTTARLNGLMLEAALQPDAPARWQLKDIDWARADLHGAKLVDLIFSSGRIDEITFRNTTFAGVVWGGWPGFEMSNVRFQGSRFDFTWFAGTKAGSVEFLNSSLRGFRIDVTNFSLVKFLTRSSAPPESNIITAEVTVLENGVVINREQPPAPGVLDLSNPAETVSFEGVVFDGVHFRGWIRPEWFKDCSFLNCTFPTSLEADALRERNTSVENCVWKDEDLD